MRMGSGARLLKEARPFPDALRTRGGCRRARAAPRTRPSRRARAPRPAVPRAALQTASSRSPFTLEKTAKHFPGAKRAYLDRAHRNAQHAPDLVKLHSLDVTEDDDFPVLHGKLGERALERGFTLVTFNAVRGRFPVVGHLGHVWPFLMTGSEPGRATLFPQDVLAPVQRDTTDPCRESRLPSKISEREVGLDERLLSDVLSLRRVWEHAK